MGYHTKRRQQRQELGLCRDCKHPLENQNRTACNRCASKSSDQAKKRRQLLKQEHICIICGKQETSKDRVTCDVCKKRSYECKRKKFFLYRSTHFNGAYKTSHTARQIASLWKSQRGLCALSGVKLTVENAELDHIIPKAKGGNHELENLRWVTKLVNRAKNDLLDAEFVEMCNAVSKKATK